MCYIFLVLFIIYNTDKISLLFGRKIIMKKLDVTKRIENTSITKCEKRKPFVFWGAFFALIFEGMLATTTGIITTWDGNGNPSTKNSGKPKLCGFHNGYEWKCTDQ